jgi:hypothetical protein
LRKIPKVSAGAAGVGGQDGEATWRHPLTPKFKSDLLTLYKSGTATKASKPKNLDQNYEHFKLADGITAHRHLSDPTEVHVENTNGPAPTMVRLTKAPATKSSPQE